MRKRNESGKRKKQETEQGHNVSEIRRQRRSNSHLNKSQQKNQIAIPLFLKGQDLKDQKECQQAGEGGYRISPDDHIANEDERINQ